MDRRAIVAFLVNRRWNLSILGGIVVMLYIMIDTPFASSPEREVVASSVSLPQQRRQQEEAGEDPETLLKSMSQLLKGCGDVCRYEIPGTPSLFFDHVEKRVNCSALMSNAAIDASRPEGLPAPKIIPSVMLGDFTYGGKVPVGSWYLDQRYSGGESFSPVWTKEQIDEWSEQCGRGALKGSYSVVATGKLLEALKTASLKDAHVLVIGSERPWVEACLLHVGARHVTTLEYGRIQSHHPQVSALTPDVFRANWREYLDSFDAVVTFSSVEHSGLGRYGDALNPWGDRQAMARAWCMTKAGGKLVVGVPTGDKDAIVYNAHRIYGQVMLPHLLANWKQLRDFGQAGHGNGIFLLEK